MIYPQNFESKISFDKVREQISALCISSLGQYYVEKMKFSNDFVQIQKLIAQSAEFLKIVSSDEYFPAQYYFDVNQHLENVRIEGSFIDEQAFGEIKLSLNTIQHCLLFFQKKEEADFPMLKELSNNIMIDRDLLKKIDKIIDDNGKIRDNASQELQRIRMELLSEQSSLRKNLDRILKFAKSEGFAKDDVAMTLRNGRMVIPILAENKRKIKGLVHDESATGQTVFIEPIEVFDSNNRIKELENDEKRELIRILTSLSQEIRAFLPELKSAYRFLGLIDFIRAKAKFAQKINAQAQNCIKSTQIDWYKTYNPILYLTLKEHKVNIVPLSIKLDNVNHILVISGPNAGGKSVVLKTVGLLQYMHQCGLLIPNGNACKLGVFNAIFIDIGDEQSIENDLSTYSSHLTHMREITNKANEKSLILIDEFGTGTDPQYGGPIAEAILEHLTSKKVFAIVNTHYSNLKFFAENQKGVQNGAMKYDYSSLSPVYELEIGKPGNSFALEIAQNIGLNKQIIAKAKSKIGDKKINVDRLIKEVQIEKEQLKVKNEEIKKAQTNLETTLKQYNELKEFLEQNKNQAMKDAKAEAKKVLLEARNEAQFLIKKLKDTQKYDNQLIESVRTSFRDVESKIEVQNNIVEKSKSTKEADNKPLKEGDKVRIIGQEGTFKISKLKGNEAELNFGDIKTTVKLNRLQKTTGDIEIEKSHASYKKVKGIDINERLATFNPTLDLRGKRGEEALTEINKLLDNALLLGSPNLKIIHGKGDGILRKLIREHLKRTPYVANYKDEHIDFGGDGITLVELK